MKDAISRNPVILIVVLHILVATVLAALLNVWVDEAYTLDTTSGSVSYAWHQAIRFESQPPGYFLILTVWRAVAESVFLLRMFSVSCTAVAIFLAGIISRQYLGKEIPFFVLPILVAVNPMTLDLAVEMRRYALVLMLTCCLMVVFYRGFLEISSSSKYWRVVYPLLALISLYTDYFTGFLLAAQSLLLLRRGDWKSVRTQTGGLVFAGVLFLPVVFSVLAQVEVYRVHEMESLNQIQKTLKFVSYLLENLLATHWLGSFRRLAKVLFAVGVFCPLLIAASRVRSSRSNPRLIEPLLMTAMIGLCFVIVSFVSAPSVLRPRHLVVVLVPANLLLVAIASSFRRGAAIAIVGVVVATNCLAGVSIFGHLAKRGDYRRVARYIESNEIEGEPIVVFIGESAIAFQHEYAGKNIIVPLPTAVDFQTYDLGRFVFRDEEIFWTGLTAAGWRSGGIWVLTDGFTDPGGGGCGIGNFQFNCELFEKVLSENFVEDSSMEFYQARVRYLRCVSD